MKVLWVYIMNCFPRTTCNSQLILITPQCGRGWGERRAYITRELARGHTRDSIREWVSSSHFVIFNAKCNLPSTELPKSGAK